MNGLSDQAQLALKDMAWVRNLARALLRDDATADDVAQDAWLIAAEKAPTDGRPLKPWLSRVVLNLVRMRARTTKRRDARDAAVGEATPAVATPAELVERVQLQRAVAAEVLALDEPFRATVLLHYVEGLPSVEIARRLDVPEGTVRRRLKVALDRIRARLRARDDQPSGGWLAALIPFCAISRADAAPAAASKAPLAIAGALAIAMLAIVAIVVAVTRGGSSGPASVSAKPVAPRVPLPAAAGARANVPGWLVQPGVPPRRVAGTVTVDGKPAAFASVQLAVTIPNAPSLLIAELGTRPDGTFDFGLQPAATFVVSADAAQRAPLAVTVDVANPNVKPDQIAIDLDACPSRISGTVRDASGGGIAHARLTVAGHAGTSSQRDGSYAVCIPPPTLVRIDADGYGSVEIPMYLLAGDLRHDFILVPESLVTGQVVDEANRPVANAQITVTPEGPDGGRNPFGNASIVASSDDDGRFRVTGVGSGKFRVAALAEGLATRMPTMVLARPTAPTELRLVVGWRTRVNGHVVMDGKAISGARIRLVDRQERVGMVAAPGLISFSQGDGSFTFDSTPGTFEAVVAPYEVKGPREIVVDGPAVDVSIEVSRLALVRGRVTHHGVPVPNVEVHLMKGGGSTKGRADRDGKFVFDGVVPGAGRLWALSVGARSYGIRDVMISGTDVVDDVELDLALGASVKGRVVDEAARPVPGVYVRLLNRPGDDEGWSMTDARGEFDCFSMAGGSDYTAAVHPTPALQHAFAPATVSGHPVIHVRDAQDVVTGVELAIKLQRSTLRGRVVDETGAPVPDCFVMAAGLGTPSPSPSIDGIAFQPPSTMTASDGRFELTSLAPGRYNLVAAASDGSEAQVMNIAAGTDAIEIAVPRSGTIEGRLVGFAAPPTVHTVRMTPARIMGLMAIVNGDRFSFAGVPPGRYPVEALSGEQTDGALVEVRAGETAQVELRARPRVPIAGRVVELGSGAPVPGMVCHARPVMNGVAGDHWPVPESAPSDSKGQFSVRSPTGRVRVICFPAGIPFSVAGADLEVASSGTLPFELVAVRRSSTPSIPGFMLRPLMLPVVVWSIDPDGPAATSGLAVGDIVVGVNDVPVMGLLPDGASALMMNHPAGTPLRLLIERAGSSRIIEVVPRPLPPR